MTASSPLSTARENAATPDEWFAGADPADAADRAEPRPFGGRQVALVDLLDRLLAGGVVLTGDTVLGIADVDLVHISLRALIRSLGADGPEDALPWKPL